jgi:pimeloyl-ACP methyl ester carboxylesterase
MNIPAFRFDGAGLSLHFLHANGYPPECYFPLFERMKSSFSIFGMLLRPLWPDARMEELKDWHPLTADLLEFLSSRQGEPVIAVGHSIGGIVTLRAALQEPEKFRAIILIEPVLFPPYYIILWNIARWLGLGFRIHPLIQGTLRRRREFDDLEHVFQGYRNRKIFRYLTDDALRAYIKGITKPQKNGYSLAYSPEWEAHIYYTGIWPDLELWRKLKNLRVPALIIRGEESGTFWRSSYERIRRIHPGIRLATIEKSSHLVPLERPELVFDLIRSFIMEII